MNFIRRNQIEPLALPALSINEQRRLEEQLRLASETTIAFNLEPDAWAECFEGADAQRLNQDVRCQITENENAFREERRRRNKQALGATALRRQSITKEHLALAGATLLSPVNQAENILSLLVES